MPHFIMGNSLFELIWQLDAMSKGVLFVLLIMSIICFAITLYKIKMISVIRKQATRARELMNNVHNIDDILALGAMMKGTVPGYILSRGVFALKSLLQTPEGPKTSLNSKEIELLSGALDQAVEDVMAREEEYLPVLSTSASVAPLLGLFGTVWGLVHSFIEISHKQSADIAVVAPGIAEALITTLGGLMVAIPALIMFHYLQGQIRKVDVRLTGVAERFEWVIKKILFI